MGEGYDGRVVVLGEEIDKVQRLANIVRSEGINPGCVLYSDVLGDQPYQTPTMDLSGVIVPGSVVVISPGRDMTQNAALARAFGEYLEYAGTNKPYYLVAQPKVFGIDPAGLEKIADEILLAETIRRRLPKILAEQGLIHGSRLNL